MTSWIGAHWAICSSPWAAASKQTPTPDRRTFGNRRVTFRNRIAGRSHGRQTNAQPGRRQIDRPGCRRSRPPISGAIGRCSGRQRDSHAADGRDIRTIDRSNGIASALSDLRTILLGSDKERIDALSDEVQSLSEQLSDKDTLAAAIAPVLGNAIRKQISESREEVIEALYPIVGQLVMRAVSEAMRDLARSIDDRMRVTTTFDRIGAWLRSFMTGIPVSELAMRDALPFAVLEIYLIHRESGLLVWHLNREAVSDTNADLVGAMLTAIREFSEQVLGTDRESQLHELQYGDRLILFGVRQSRLCGRFGGRGAAGGFSQRIATARHHF
ncbi:MAG: hypothetical protein R2856_31835 [Caldilineaceae bacterium]